jgi:hypothetical protein
MLLLNKYASYTLLSLVLLSSCAYRKPERINKKEVGRSMYEARWSDVPLPLDRVFDVKQTYQAVDERACRFVFTTQRSLENTIAWYQQELDRSGWRVNALYRFNESAAFIADRPSKYVQLFVQRVADEQSLVTILVGLKK